MRRGLFALIAVQKYSISLEQKLQNLRQFNPMNNEEISQKIKELQVLEQSFQIFVHQKQSVQVELNEIVNAFKEVKDSSGDVYKVLSGIMIKAEKISLLKELEERKKVVELKLDSFEKQEFKLNSKIQSLREEISRFASKKNN